MKKLLLLLLATTIGYAQVPADATPLENIQITNNVTSTTATKVVVQESTGVLNTKPLDATVVQSSINPITGGAVYTGLAGKFSTPTGLTTNYLPKWNGSGFVNSIVFDNSSFVTIGANEDLGSKLNVRGTIRNILTTADIGDTVFSGIEGVSGGFQINKASGNVLTYTFNTGSNTTAFRITNSSRILINTTTDDLTNQLQVNGTISASPAVNSNQVVVKSQLDLKANLASPAFTGTPTAPTATAGTNTTQVATTAFVLANATNIPQLESNATDLTVWNNGKGNIATNTSFGDKALRVNTTGLLNTAIGNEALFSNTTGLANTSIGSSALRQNISGDNNTAVGNGALTNNLSVSNTAVGASSLSNNSNGNNNSALGQLSLGANTSGISNVAVGVNSLSKNQTGSNNTAIGTSAGFNIVGNTDLLTTNGSVFIGAQAQAALNNSNNEIVIGAYASGAGSNTATLGNTSITKTVLRGVVQMDGYTVATLPTGSIGMTAYVTNALSPVSLAAVVGGGAVVVRVFHNGVTWIVQ